MLNQNKLVIDWMLRERESEKLIEIETKRKETSKR